MERKTIAGEQRKGIRKSPKKKPHERFVQRKCFEIILVFAAQITIALTLKITAATKEVKEQMR